MKFETLNSVYQVTLLDDGMFRIVKTMELRESPYNPVGVPRVSLSICLQLGERARFDGWSTSPVTKIYGWNEEN